MVKANVPRVKELPGKAQVLAQVTTPIERVANYAVANVAHVNANLVRATGVEVALKQRVAVVSAASLKALERGEGGDGLTGTGVVGHHHAQAVPRGARNATLDGALVRGNVALHQGHVSTIKHTQANEVLQGLLGLVGLCGDHETRGVHVKAVHNARPVFALKASQVRVAAMCDKGIGQRVIHMAGAGMAHKSRLLRENHEVLILKADVQRNVGIGGKHAGGGLLLGKRHLQAISQAEAFALGRDGRGVERHPPLLDETRARASRRHAILCREERIDAHTIPLGPHEQANETIRHPGGLQRWARRRRRCARKPPPRPQAHQPSQGRE